GRLQLPIPGGLLAVLVGIALAWSTGLLKLDPTTWTEQLAQVGWRPPHLELAALWQARGQLLPWLGVIVPMGLFNLLGSLQNLESAEAAGDRYPVRSSLLINGLGTISAAALGGCFPTTLYIGHPAWKAMGARIGYSWLNGLVMGSACLLGLFGLIAQVVPIEAGMAIVLYIGLVIAAQAFQATPPAHAPAVALGLLVAVPLFLLDAPLAVTAILGTLVPWLGLAGWPISIVAARLSAPYLEPLLTDLIRVEGISQALAWGIPFIVVVVLWFAFSSLVSPGLSKAGLGGLDRWLGFLFGLPVRHRFRDAEVIVQRPSISAFEELVIGFVIAWRITSVISCDSTSK
ncbi:MAG: CvpA family protein, partial [Synechococcaceae bacterium WB9_4xC_028]|nr:CvpA family protein [Synechococcaceae bacterium WB9_4xC_028]